MNTDQCKELRGLRERLAACCCGAMGIVSLVSGQNIAPETARTAVSPPPPAFRPETNANPRNSSQEKEIDRQHLERIYKAISAYYYDHQDLPNWLSDLVPQYLSDPNDLISPVETRTGKSVLYGRTDPKLRTSYVYEFNAGAAPEEFNRGSTAPLTCKQWKLKQLEKFGLVTPILRCHLHNPVLNVAYSGQIYETGLLWENDPRTAALVEANPALGPKPGAAAGVPVHVQVVDAETGKPVGAAAVRGTLGSEFGLLPPISSTTDTNGIVTVPLGEWKVNFLILSASHPLYQPAQFEWNRAKVKEETVPAEIKIRLAHYPSGASR